MHAINTLKNINININKSIKKKIIKKKTNLKEKKLNITIFTFHKSIKQKDLHTLYPTMSLMNLS
jgi:hypothetical protein